MGEELSHTRKTDEEEMQEDLLYFADAIEYFDTHDMSEEMEKMPEVHFEYSPNARRKRFALDVELAEQLQSIAGQRGISAETLLNEWVWEKVAEPPTGGTAG